MRVAEDRRGLGRWVRLGCAALVWAAAGAPAPTPVAAQEPAVVRLAVVGGDGALEGAAVRLAGRTALTGAGGQAVLRVPAGRHELVVERIGHERHRSLLVLGAGADTTFVVRLEERAVEEERIVVVSTRGERRIEEEPLRVEVLTREEIEEKLLMTPGSIAMLLNETSGLRVQESSSGVGGATVSVHGLRGRYTQILVDGLPLHGARAGSLGLLQIPPMDLGRVEVIKGAASALYGPAALGGVINLISRQPDGEREALLNRSSVRGTDIVAWASGALADDWAYTLLAGAHDQARTDVSGDGWADIPGHRRGVVRPRAFWRSAAGHSLMVTGGLMAEDRSGGTMDGAVAPDGRPFPEDLDTRRVDGGFVARRLLSNGLRLDLRGSGQRVARDRRRAAVRERDRLATLFGEAALAGASGPHYWVAGLAVQREAFRARDVDGFDERRTVLSAFVQEEFSPAGPLSVSASLRGDLDADHGGVLSPRASALWIPAAGWTVRVSTGTGYLDASPITERTEAAGLAMVDPPAGLRREKARTASVDVGRTFGPIELNATLFASVIDRAIAVREPPDRPGRLELFNLPGPTRTRGTELLARFHLDPLHVTASHTYTRSTEPATPGPGRGAVPLTPRHAAGLVGMWESEEDGRVGVELYYTGRQRLHDDPFRTVTPSFLVLGLLVERRLGPVRAFLNAENLTDVRQSRHDPLVRAAPAPGGVWTTDRWAPLEGRSFNGGIRVAF